MSLISLGFQCLWYLTPDPVRLVQAFLSLALPKGRLLMHAVCASNYPQLPACLNRFCHLLLNTARQFSLPTNYPLQQLTGVCYPRRGVFRGEARGPGPLRSEIPQLFHFFYTYIYFYLFPIFRK